MAMMIKPHGLTLSCLAKIFILQDVSVLPRIDPHSWCINRDDWGVRTDCLAKALSFSKPTASEATSAATVVELWVRMLCVLCCAWPADAKPAMHWCLLKLLICLLQPHKEGPKTNCTTAGANGTACGAAQSTVIAAPQKQTCSSMWLPRVVSLLCSPACS